MNNLFMTDLKPQKIVASNHSDWLGLRTGIGSSDVPTIFGISHFKSPVQLWMEKTGKVEIVEQETERLRAGHILEPIIAQEFSERNGIKIIEGSEAEYLYVHPEYDYMRASPDREFEFDKDTIGILECKTDARKIETLPLYWRYQVTYQMGIAQRIIACVSWLEGCTFHFGTEVIGFDKELYEQIMEGVIHFWEYNVQRDIPPTARDDKDIKLLYPTAVNKSVEANDDVCIAYERLKKIMEQEKELEKEKNQLKLSIQNYMKDADTLTYIDRKLCTFSNNKTKQVFDEVQFAKEHPELYAKYVTTSTAGRTFRVK